MYHKLWNLQQVEKLHNDYIKEGNYIGQNISFELMLPKIKEQIGILDQYYGSDRDPEKDLGGWLALFLEPITEEDSEYKELLGKYHIESSTYAEVDEAFAEDNSYFYKIQLYILSSDYGLILIFPSYKKKEGIPDA